MPPQINSKAKGYLQLEQEKLWYVLGGTYIGVAPILETLLVFSTLGICMSAVHQDSIPDFRE